MSEPDSLLPPGPQARRSALALKVLGFALPAIGLIVAAALVAGGLASGDGSLLATAATVAIAFVGSGYLAWRRAHPPEPRHLTLSIEGERQLRRGEAVRARLEISDPARAGERLEVGLVCEVLYDVWERGSQEKGRERRTRRANAVEVWQPARPTERLQSVTLEVPRDAPYSHEGRCLSFRWRLVAREPRSWRADPRRELPIRVLP